MPRNKPLAEDVDLKQIARLQQDLPELILRTFLMRLLSVQQWITGSISFRKISRSLSLKVGIGTEKKSILSLR